MWILEPLEPDQLMRPGQHLYQSPHQQLEILHLTAPSHLVGLSSPLKQILSSQTIDLGLPLLL